MEKIKEALSNRILVLDGAMGTMIQRRKLKDQDFHGQRFKDHSIPLKGNNDLLSITRPDVIQEIHREYLEVGADIIETNTFSSTSIAQDDYGLQDIVFEMNVKSAVLAREVADEFTKRDPSKSRYVAGSIGPTNRSGSLSPNVHDPGFRAVTFDQLLDAYYSQAKALMEGGADLLLVETIFDTLNAKAALFAIQNLEEELGKKVPTMISGTIVDASGRNLSGQTVEAFLVSLSHVDLLSIGLNCSFGAKEIRPYLQVISKEAPFLISVHPNAGLPNEFGEYDQTPDEMASEMEKYLDEGLINIIGGCCGTTPEHIEKLVGLASRYSPREIGEVVY
jgi:5-methyltetrahydrofolate--homocysteine methyltransferase